MLTLFEPNSFFYLPQKHLLICRSGLIFHYLLGLHEQKPRKFEFDALRKEWGLYDYLVEVRSEAGKEVFKTDALRDLGSNLVAMISRRSSVVVGLGKLGLLVRIFDYVYRPIIFWHTCF